MIGKYYVITDEKVITARRLGTINRKMKIKFDEDEMVSCGPDKVVKVTRKDIEFLRDKRNIERIPIANLYKTDQMSKWIMIAILIINFIILVRG
jgi:hypothetical protein